jgi:hypothetical protein
MQSLLVRALASLLLIVAASPTTHAQPNCAPSGTLQYLCGAQNAEDIVQLGNSDWLIVSGMSGQGPGGPIPAHIYLVDRPSRTLTEWFPGDDPVIRLDRARFGDCPGPLNTDNFSAHGLALREQRPGEYLLYMTSHGEREAIEVFSVAAAGNEPEIAWIGCVVLPDRTFANSVAILSDGGFVTTKMMDPTDPAGFGGIMAGNITGLIYEWHPGGEVEAIAGTELSGANGIEVSPDDRWVYVAAIGSSEVVRFDRLANPATKATVAISIRPDNLRWSAAGTLYTVGGNLAAPEPCAAEPCAAGWSVIEVDPDTLAAAQIASVAGSASLQGASTALPVADEIWIGTFNGDRVGILPRP